MRRTRRRSEDDALVRRPSRDSVERLVPPLHVPVRRARVKVLSNDGDGEDVGLQQGWMCL